MNLMPFFTGKLAREEATSAFLAMLLDGSPGFRSHFFSILPPHVADVLATEDFDVATEVREVDIRLDGKRSDIVVLIENKILTSSATTGQLSRYYADQITNEPNKSVVLIYLAPGEGVGSAEVKSVQSDPRYHRRGIDLVYRIGWSHVLQFRDRLTNQEPLAALLHSGFEAVNEAIDASRSVRFPEVGVRAQLIGAVRAALVELRVWKPNVRFASWAMRNRHQVETQQSRVTIYVGAEFDVSPEPDNHPIGVATGDKLRVTLTSIFGQSAVAARIPERRSAWKPLLDAGLVDIEGVGTHAIDPKQRWFRMDEPFIGTESELAGALATRMQSIINHLEPHL